MDWLTRLRQLPEKRRSLLYKILIVSFSFAVIMLWVAILPKSLAVQTDDTRASLYDELVTAASDFADQTTGAKQQIDSLVEQTNILLEKYSEERTQQQQQELSLAAKLEQQLQISLARKGTPYTYQDEAEGIAFTVPAGVAVIKQQGAEMRLYSFCFGEQLRLDTPCSSTTDMPALLVAQSKALEGMEAFEKVSSGIFEATTTIAEFPAEILRFEDETLQLLHLTVNTEKYLLFINSDDDFEQTILTQFIATFTFEQ